MLLWIRKAFQQFFKRSRKRTERGRPVKVFVSSTVYDLLDVRAEVCALLTSMGISPVLSDDKLSEFDTSHATNSIQTCLINLEDSDEVIVILDQRYGPRLGKAGFDDISATHLEYKRARELNKVVHVFVRDRLEADFITWKKNGKNPELRLPWVDKADHGLFELLDSHRTLKAKPDKNWFSIFTNVIDLMQGIRRILEPRIKPARIVEAISQNRFPLISIDHDTEYVNVGNVPSFKFSITITNIGGAAAFNFVSTFNLEMVESETKYVFAPGQVTNRFILANGTRGNPVISGEMYLQYDSVIGVRVRECYELGLIIQGGMAPMMYGKVILKERTYHNAPEIQVTISDS